MVGKHVILYMKILYPHDNGLHVYRNLPKRMNFTISKFNYFGFENNIELILRGVYIGFIYRIFDNFLYREEVLISPQDYDCLQIILYR